MGILKVLTRGRQSGQNKSRSLRTRWLIGCICGLLAGFIIAVSVSAAVSSTKQEKRLRAEMQDALQLADAALPVLLAQPDEKYASVAHRFVCRYDDHNDLELQLLDADGCVEASSRESQIGRRIRTEDVKAALDNGDTQFAKSKDPRFLSLSAPVSEQDEAPVRALRVVSDLEVVRRQVIHTVLITAVIGLGIIALFLLGSLLYIRTISEPVTKLTDMASRIADGSYGIQVKKTYNDEIGVLTDTVNTLSEALSKAEKLQTEFISSVSHELRTPLTAITGWSETLMYDEAIQGDSRRGIQIISSEASRLAKLVTELLDFTRIQDGRFLLNVESLDLAAELEDLVFSYGGLLRQDGVELCYTPCEGDAPLILGDPARLKQVFLNILDNAAKYGRDGACVEVSLCFDEAYITVTVRDHGSGIPENELPFVKQKFYKGSGKERGSGIGLAVCEEIIVRHMGELIIENAPDGGVLVTVKLPVAKE